MSDVQCTKCERDLPDMKTATVTTGEEDDCDLIALIFVVRCVCGEETWLKVWTDGNGEAN